MAKKKKKSAGSGERPARRPAKKKPGGAGSSSVPQLRKKLDDVDRQLLTAMNLRAELARQIGERKQADGQPVYDPQRESEVLQQAAESNSGPLDDESVRHVYRELISATRSVQAPTRVAYLGPEFTFSHLAAIERFGQSAELLPVGTIASVFEEVERGQAEFGVVPMENSTDGRVSDTLDCFSRSAVRICGELPLRIRHCLLSTGARDGVKTVYSKPQPLSQCRNWLAKHLPSAALQEVASTAEAARLAKSDPSTAAVASAQAGTNYGLPILARGIEDQADNVTRFAVIAKETGPRTGKDKTALMIEIAHQPGALADSMAIFKRNRLNMTWIESFPIPGSRGRYLFFIEFIGHHSELRARRAVAALGKKSLRLEILGSYAQLEPIG